MVAVLYVYAIFLIGLCIGTAFMGFSAFAITQRTMLLYLSAFALCYAFEQAIVFFNEFLAQNLPFRNDRFSDMEDPLVHIVTGALLCQMLWMAFLTFFDDRRPTMRFVPLALFLILSIATLLLPTNDESLRKWLMYSARQLCLSVGCHLLRHPLWAHRLKNAEDALPKQGAFPHTSS